MPTHEVIRHSIEGYVRGITNRLVRVQDNFKVTGFDARTGYFQGFRTANPPDDGAIVNHDFDRGQPGKPRGRWSDNFKGPNTLPPTGPCSLEIHDYGGKGSIETGKFHDGKGWVLIVAYTKDGSEYQKHYNFGPFKYYERDWFEVVGPIV